MSNTHCNARIVVVDDDAGMVRAVTRVLSRQYTVEAFTSAREALDRVPSIKPDLAIVDIRMPEMNGFELMGHLHAIHAGIDVILMTGNFSETDADLIRAIEHGAYYYIQKPFDSRVLRTLVDRCVELRVLRADRARHLQRLEQELDNARRFQQSMLPPAASAINGAAVSAHYVACNELAGDFYDYAAVGTDAVAFVVADVVGHGASAAMLTAIVKSTFHAVAAEEYEPLAVARSIRDGFLSFEASQFVTLFCGRFNAASGELEYVNAGHPPAVITLPTAKTRLLTASGPMISSAFADFDWECESVQLGPTDQVVAYTDGVTEASDGTRWFGEQQLVDQITRSKSAGAALLEEIVTSVTTFAGDTPLDDDMTLLCLERATEP